jgi:hypothetical protein
MASKGKAPPYIMIRLNPEQITEITEAAERRGFSYPAIYARTVVLDDARKTLARPAQKARAR